MTRTPLAVRRAAAHRAALTATALTVIAAATAAAAATSFSGAITTAAVRRTLTATPGSAVLVTAPVATAGAASADGRRADAAISRALGGVPVTFAASLRSQELDLPGGAAGGPHAQVRIVSLPGLSSQAVLTAGSWPAGAAPRTAAAPFPVAVPAVVARLLRLAPGDTLTTRDSVSGAAVRVRVTGVYQPRRPSSRYWSLSPVGPSGVVRAGGFSVYGPLATSPQAAARPGFPLVSAGWLAIPDFARMPGTGLTALGTRLQGVLGGPRGAGGLAPIAQSSVTTSLPTLLTALGTAVAVARSQLLIGVAILLVIAAGAVAVSVRLLAGQREAEIALLAARGAARSQLAARGAAEAVVLAACAALAGPLLGAPLASLLTHAGALTRAGLRTGPAPGAGAWLAAAAVALACAVIVALPWLRTPPSPVRQRAGAARRRATATAAAAGADLALIALAALAGWELARDRAAVPAGPDGTLGIDPVLVISPALMLVAGTVVVLRLLPVATRLADAAAARGRGLVTAIASWHLSRRPLRQAGPALLAVLAVAATVITLAEHASWQRSVADQAGFAVGADERVTLPPGAPLALGSVTGVTGAPGVRAATPAVRTQVTLPQGNSATLLALDARRAAHIVPLRAGLAARSPAGELRGLAAGMPGPASAGSGAAIPGRPTRLRVTAALGAGPGGPASLALQLTAPTGAAYVVPVGAVPADGRPHQLTVTVTAGRHAGYPLHITGFTLEYTMPTAGSAAQSVTIGPVRAAAGAGPFGPAFPVLPRRGRLITTAGTLSDAGVEDPPQVSATTRTPAGGLRVGYRLGHGVFVTADAPRVRVDGSLSVTANPGLTALPALATSAFLTATGSHAGGLLHVTLGGTSLPVRLTGVISHFPTVTGGGLVVDQAALQDMLRAAGAAPLPVTEWWLRTSRPPALTGLPPGTTLAVRSRREASLRSQPLSAGPQQALLAIAVAAVALAIAGFVVSVATGRERAHDVALLHALGAPPRRVTGLLCLEQAMLATFAAGAGLVLGALLSELIIPAVSLTAQATHPVPGVVVEIPWGTAVASAAVIAATPALVVAVAGRRRGPSAARLRVEEQT